MTTRNVCAGAGIALLSVGWLSAQHPETSSSSKTHTSQVKRTTSNPPKPDPGIVTNNVYRNAGFGFSYKIPFGWVDRTAEMQDDGADPAKSRVLLAAFERPPEASGENINSAIVIAAEKVSSYSGLKTASDYFGPLTELATAKGFHAADGPYEFEVGGKHVVRGNFSKQRSNLSVQQSSLVVIESGWALSFTFIAPSEDEVEELIENLSFAKKNGERR
ncbi:MAG: hypothetical protein JOY93_08350 [Acidobacteriales bacterium]|nr:hypothetical protein [Terriglobales bacterium]